MEIHTPERASFLNKFFSLWAIIYVLTYILTSQFSPVISWPFLQDVVIWFGKAFLHLADLHKIKFTGSGDTTFDYVLILFDVVFSFILALIILIADRKRKSYRNAYLFTIVIARYYVAYTMLVYGFIKIFHGQFGPLGFHTMEEKFGYMSPMRVLWSFMQASHAYSFFGGLMEVIGGTLLLFRKTKTFGALFSMTVMINVAVLNFTYDVPVKIFSTHIVLLCFFILSYEWSKLNNFFIAHKIEVLNYDKIRVRKKWIKIVLISFKVLLLAWAFYTLFVARLFMRAQGTVPLEGSYTTQTFIRNNDTLPAGTGDTTRWTKVFINYANSLVAQRGDSLYSGFASNIDTIAKKIILKKHSPHGSTTDDYAVFTYQLQGDTLMLEGNMQSDSIRMTFIRKQMKDYPLVKRGFHWINEYPYNR